MTTRAILNSGVFGLVASLSLLFDVRRRRIPDELVGTGLIAAALLTPSLVTAIADGVLGFLLFYLIRLLCHGRLGLGDVKLSAYFAAVLGADIWWLTVGLASAAALLTMALRARAGRHRTVQSLPFAPFLSLAALASLLLSRLAPVLFDEVWP